jgi:hypothetical protein
MNNKTKKERGQSRNKGRKFRRRETKEGLSKDQQKMKTKHEKEG